MEKGEEYWVIDEEERPLWDEASGGSGFTRAGRSYTQLKAHLRVAPPLLSSCPLLIYRCLSHSSPVLFIEFPFD